MSGALQRPHARNKILCGISRMLICEGVAPLVRSSAYHMMKIAKFQDLCNITTWLEVIAMVVLYVARVYGI
jgi:hypothetical protein